MTRYNHRERLECILAGDRPDRPAASFWRHFFHMESTAEGTTEAMVWFQRRYDWDFVKINPRADYHVQDWGVQLGYSRDEFKKHTKVAFPIETAADWARIQPLAPSAPALAEHLKVVSEVRKALGKEIHLFMTVFTPLSLLGRLVGDLPRTVGYLREDTELVLAALEAVTTTYERFVSEVRNAGADGLFFATTHWASSELITWAEYERFGVPFDLRVIRAAEADAVNILHVCDPHCYLEELAALDYNSPMLSWDSEHPTNVPLDRALGLFPTKVLVGGVDHEGWLRYASPEEITRRIQRLKVGYDGSRLIVGPGCAIPPEVPDINLRAIREAL